MIHYVFEQHDFAQLAPHCFFTLFEQQGFSQSVPQVFTTFCLQHGFTHPEPQLFSLLQQSGLLHTVPT
tara:strand:+ start:198 stop:401 length:204 start_codon:yes stop_codon:yes gene_type:complete